MNFPLYVGTYQMDGRIYRRNFERDDNFGDTADLYAHSPPSIDAQRSSDDEAINSSDEMTTTNSSDFMMTDIGEEMDDESQHQDEFIVNYDNKLKKWSAKMNIPVALRRFVIGPKGIVKRKIEEETSCRLKFPSKKKKKNPVEIVSIKSEENVMRCRDRLKLIMLGARNRAAYTHFVSIPMTHRIIQENFEKFVDTIKNDMELPDSCKEETIFQTKEKLHLTVTMLSLLDENERKLASKSLKTTIDNCINEIMNGEPLEVEVKGLETMNDDPACVHVLYALVSSEKLANIANAIAQTMSKTGFAPQQDSVKIHLTLMNTRYAWEKIKKKIKMNVVELLKKYRDYEFGTITIPEIHISDLKGSKDESGYYSSIAIFPLHGTDGNEANASQNQ